MEPLAVRMRPNTLDEIIGQQHILAPDKLLYRAIKADRLGSIILYGPPGTGKTTIAHVIANETSGEFLQLNATTSGKKDMETAVATAQKNAEDNKKTILFIDEIHRFNKAQQDYLLPFLESGLITLIGATTENPYFEVNKALLSRSRIFELKQLEREDIKKALERALVKDDLFKFVAVETPVLDFLADACGGDVRSALNALELGALTTEEEPTSGIKFLTMAIAQECIQKPAVMYDKDGDMHYDIISAFIKSLRGSDPDAALYYLARMIEAGEDPKFIARRLMVHACEDVGCADPQALTVAVSASLAVEHIGMPEGRIPLSMATIYIAMAPKCNTACAGIDAALDYIHEHPSSAVPPHLQDSHYKSASKLGRGVDYLYPHDFPMHWVPQRYLPADVLCRFYQNSHMGYEKTQADYQNLIRAEYLNQRQQASQPPDQTQ